MRLRFGIRSLIVCCSSIALCIAIPALFGPVKSIFHFQIACIPVAEVNQILCSHAKSTHSLNTFDYVTMSDVEWLTLSSHGVILRSGSFDTSVNQPDVFLYSVSEPAGSFQKSFTALHCGSIVGTVNSRRFRGALMCEINLKMIHSTDLVPSAKVSDASKRRVEVKSLLMFSGALPRGRLVFFKRLTAGQYHVVCFKPVVDLSAWVLQDMYQC